MSGSRDLRHARREHQRDLAGDMVAAPVDTANRDHHLAAAGNRRLACHAPGQCQGVTGIAARAKLDGDPAQDDIRTEGIGNETADQNAEGGPADLVVPDCGET